MVMLKERNIMTFKVYNSDMHKLINQKVNNMF